MRKTYLPSLFFESPTHPVDSSALNNMLHNNFQLNCAEGANCGLLPSHFKITRSSNLMGILPKSLHLWSANAFAIARALVECKREVRACFTSKQPHGCGASTTAVRKSEFGERGIFITIALEKFRSNYLNISPNCAQRGNFCIC